MRTGGGLMLTVAVIAWAVSAPNACLADEIHDAAAAGDLEAVADLLVQSPELADCRDESGWPLLARAAWLGHKDVAEVLLSAGASVDAVCPVTGETPLLLAVRNGQDDLVELLLDHGANPDRTDALGATALHKALYLGHAHMVKLLLMHGAEIDILTASALGRADAVRRLVQADEGKATARGPAFGETPLHWAARAGHMDIARLLVASGANVNASDRARTTPLHWACWEGRTELASLLIAEGANTEANAFPYLGTPLHWAAAAGHEDTVRFLLSHGAATATPLAQARAANKNRPKKVYAATARDDTPPPFSGTPLHWAAQLGHEPVVRLLLARGADPNARAATFESPFHWAVRAGGLHVSELRKAMSRQLEVKADSFKMPPEWLRQEQSEDDADELSARWVASVRVGDCGFTPLHWVAHTGQRGAADLLLQSGAHVNDGGGASSGTALHWAARAGHAELAEFLLASGADAHADSELLGTPLHWAARTGQSAVGEVLVMRGADVNARDGNGRTALHLAALYGHGPFAELIVANGADVNAKDVNDQTPVAMAVAAGYQEVAELLRQHGAGE